MNPQEYSLNIRPGAGYAQTVKVSQGDVGRPLRFNLLDGAEALGIQAGTSITIHGTKPSGLGFTETCTWIGSVASVATTLEMTQENGTFPAELVLTLGNDVIGTANFMLNVERSPHDESVIDGTYDVADSIFARMDSLEEGLDTTNEEVTRVAATVPAVDATLTITGAAADAKKTGDEITQLKTDLSGVFETVSSLNKFNGNLSVGYMNLTGGINATADYAHTDKIPVYAQTFVITADNILNNRRMNVPLRFLTAFDENENVLSEYGQQRIGTDSSFIDTDGVNVITLDASVKYVVLSIYKPNDKYKNICVSFDTSFIDYVPYGNTLKVKAEAIPDGLKEIELRKFLAGKTVAVFGDSIMYGAGSDSKGAVDILAEKYGMTVAKYCVSGSTMGIRTDDPSYTVDEVHHIAKQVRNAIAANIIPDLIVFNGGTNDIGGQIPIGEMSEAYTEPSAEDLFANGFETVAYLLKKNFVGVPTIYMRAHNMSSRTYTGQVQYGELGNQIAEKWGIRNVDMYKRMNTQLAEYRTLYLADYTHPNNAGYNKYYVPALEDFIFTEII